MYHGNYFLNKSEFWAIKDEAHLDVVLHITFEIIRVSSILLQPYCPQLAGNVLEFLSVKDRTFKDAEINEKTLSRSIVFDLEKK